MATSVKDMVIRAMALPPEQRAQLADKLVESLDVAALSDLDKKWLSEAKLRREEVRNGYAAVVPGPQALQQVRDAIKR